MRLMTPILLSSLLLAGCAAQWPSHRSGPRWTGTPSSPAVNSAPASMPGGNSASGDAFGSIHGIAN